MVEKYSGKCLCGAVSFSCNQAPAAVVACNCTDCQAYTSGGPAILVASMEEGCSLEGRESLSSYTVAGESGGTVERFFCRQCGVKLMSKPSVSENMLFFSASALEDSSWCQPMLSLWDGSRQPWMPQLNNCQIKESQ